MKPFFVGDPDGEDRRPTDERERGHGNEGHPHAGNVEQAAQDGADDGGDLGRDRAAGDQPRHAGVRHHGWGYGTNGRGQERLSGAEGDDKEKDRGGRQAARVTDIPGHYQGHQTVRKGAESGHVPAVEPVDDVPGHHHEQSGGGKLRQPEEAKIELTAGQLVHQQAKHRRLGQVRHRSGERRAE